MSEIANQFTGLPIRDLIGGPLMAACEAQSALAYSTSDFIQKVGFKPNDKGGFEGVNLVKFEYNQIDASGASKKMEIDVPLLSVVKIPSLAIKTVDIQFDMEVKSSTSETSKNSADASVTVGGKWFGAKVEIKGSVSTSKENTRTTDNSAKYHVELHAADEGMPEGLSRVLDILNAVIVPKETEKKGEGNNKSD